MAKDDKVIRDKVSGFDNRDLDETWINTEYSDVPIEISREEAMCLVEGFFVNAILDEKGCVDKEKVKVNGEALVEALQDLYDWVHDVILECDCDVDSGAIVIQNHELTPKEEFERDMPELAREMRRG